MLTRREEDILILENDEKNTELVVEWVEGKEDDRAQPAPPQEEGANYAPVGR